MIKVSIVVIHSHSMYNRFSSFRRGGVVGHTTWATQVDDPETFRMTVDKAESKGRRFNSGPRY